MRGAHRTIPRYSTFMRDQEVLTMEPWMERALLSAFPAIHRRSCATAAQGPLVVIADVQREVADAGWDLRARFEPTVHVSTLARCLANR